MKTLDEISDYKEINDKINYTTLQGAIKAGYPHENHEYDEDSRFEVKLQIPKKIAMVEWLRKEKHIDIVMDINTDDETYFLKVYYLGKLKNSLPAGNMTYEDLLEYGIITGISYIDNGW